MSEQSSAKRSRVMESSTLTTLSETGCDDATLFERFYAAQKELVLAQKNMEDIRQQIRSRGNYEPDSLLYLCNGDDNHHILSHIMKYMSNEDVGRCEIVCSTLKLQAKHYWDMKLNDSNINNHPTLRSSSATCSRDVVMRYQFASTLAKSIGDMKYSISKHLVEATYDRYRDTMRDRRVPDHCEGCEFPDLNFDPLRRETRDQYELFVRFCRTDDNTLLAEGFLPCTIGDLGEVTLRLRSMDCSNWPQFSELTGLIETCEGYTFADNPQYNRMLDDCMSELTVVVVGVHKVTSKASLVVAQSNFGDSPDPMHGIDNMSDHGFCYPRGCMLAKSHGELELKEYARSTNRFFQDDSTTYHTRYCTAKLAMKFSNHEWRSESGEIIKKECHWELGCDCDTYQKDY